MGRDVGWGPLHHHSAMRGSYYSLRDSRYDVIVDYTASDGAVVVVHQVSVLESDVLPNDSGYLVPVYSLRIFSSLSRRPDHFLRGREHTSSPRIVGTPHS